jgi:hypothetical protein
VADIGKTDTGEPKILTAFVKWVAPEYLAERYIVVRWNHGEGGDDTDLWARRRDRRLGRLAWPS